MEYPDLLLPKPHYKKLLFDELHSGLYLVRHTDSSENRDENGDLKSDCVALATDHLRDYSTNLLGEFAPTDCKLQLVSTSPRFRYLRELWELGDTVTPPIFGIDFKLAEGRGCFYLKVDDFHKVEFGSVSHDLTTLPICNVLHTPTNANYWHCSLRWIHEEVDTFSTKGKKYVLKLARSFIIENAIFEEPAYQAIPSEEYQELPN